MKLLDILQAVFSKERDELKFPQNYERIYLTIQTHEIPSLSPRLIPPARSHINPITKRPNNPVKTPPATIPRLTTLLVPADFAIPLLPVDDDPPDPLVLNIPPWTALGTTNPACAAADLNAATVSFDYE